MKATLLTGFLTICCTYIFAQPEVIHLKNPSFEDYPRAARVPIGWIDCGFPGESPADTHPSGEFEVTQHPIDKESYLGLVTRDNDTWERVGQKLVTPIIAGQCYIFKLSLCRSANYVSRSRMTGLTANYTEPIKLKIWGGFAFCDKKEALAETEIIEHSNWKDYIFMFNSNHNYDYILLEAFYNQPVLFPYNGNLLIDNASPIVPAACDSLTTWTIKEYNATLEAAGSKTIKITEEDIDESTTKIATVTAEKDSLPLIPAIYYNSRLGTKEKKVVLENILEFIKKNPSTKANIIIQEQTMKARKLQKKLLIKELRDLGISKERYSISLFKN